MVPDNNNANDPVDDKTAESPVGERPQPVWGQLDLRFEEASRMLDQRLAEVIRRENAVAKLQPELRDALARAEEQRLAFEHGQAELTDVTEARRAVDQRHEEVAQREAALAVEANELERGLAELAGQRSELERGRAEVARARQELDDRRSELERGQTGLAELATLRQQNEAGLGELAQREAELANSAGELVDREARLANSEAELARQKLAAEQALARAEELQAASQHGIAERETAEQLQGQLAASLLAVAERERLLGEREAELERNLAERERLIRQRELAVDRPAAPVGSAPETNDLEERAKWLIDVVKAAAKEEAETIVKEAHEQAELIRARAATGRPPTEA